MVRLADLVFMWPRDVALFWRSARTDASLAGLRDRLGNRAAFEAVYQAGDPWASGDARYLYQRRKYDVIAGLLPRRRFASALDLGCGAGLLARRLAARADAVLGIDLSAAAVEQARRAHQDIANLRFEQGDIADLPDRLNGEFDLMVLADSLYYLPPPLERATFDAAAGRLARLLRPGGICLLANHYFAGFDADSRLSRRIHDSFAAAPNYRPVAAYRRPFYIVSVLQKV